MRGMRFMVTSVCVGPHVIMLLGLVPLLAAAVCVARVAADGE